MNSSEGIGMTSRRTRERLVARLRSRGIADERVLGAIAATPRHTFVDEALAHRAYEETALPIGAGQTISQPFVVARMTEALLAGRERLHRVLEIGTGSGYQCALLAALADEVYSIERVAVLLERAVQRLNRLPHANIRVRQGDGRYGWPDFAPFDGILVTAAGRIAAVLLEQLAEGGRLVAPVGDGPEQELILATRREGRIEQQVLGSVRFVPLLPGTTAGSP